MAYLTESDLATLGFRSLGRNVRISEKASIYDHQTISIGDNSRIDDFCVVSGNVSIGRNVHLTVFCNLAGGRAGIVLDDFVTLAYGCHIAAQTDDYSGRTMANSTVPARFKHETSAEVHIGRHSILGTGCVVLPGVRLAEGTAGGARTLFVHDTEPWGIYLDSPARRLRDREKALLALEQQLLAEEQRGDFGS